MYKLSKGSCTRQCLGCSFFRRKHIEKSRNVEAVIGVSRFILDKHVNSGLFDGVEKHVIHNLPLPMDLGNGVVSMDVRQKVRIGFIGRLNPYKGIEVLIRAFNEISADSRDVELLIAGKGDAAYEQKLRDLSRNNPRIRFLGHVPSDQFYKLISVLVVPSLWHDPAPLVIIEAMRLGIPVLGSTRGGIPELVGEAEWLFNPDKLEELVQLLRQVSDPLEISKMRDQVKERAKLFNQNEFIDRLSSIYENFTT